MLSLGEVYIYRAKDDTSKRSGWFMFKILRKKCAYRAYVIKRPSLNGRDSSLSKIHMLRDGKHCYVCVVGEVHSKDKMKKIAQLWAKRYLRYAETGMDYNMR